MRAVGFDRAMKGWATAAKREEPRARAKRKAPRVKQVYPLSLSSSPLALGALTHWFTAGGR